jgi:uncharacterized protein YbjT (DUF2867 family)
MDNFVLPQWGLYQGVFTTALLPSTKQQLIAVDDIGALAALMFEQGTEPGGRILEIAGDELTPLEMATSLSASLGRRIPYLQMPAEVLLQLNENSGKGYARINAGEMIAAGTRLYSRLCISPATGILYRLGTTDQVIPETCNGPNGPLFIT